MRSNHHTSPGRTSVYADVADAIVEPEEITQPDPQTVTAERTTRRTHADAFHALGDLYSSRSELPIDSFDVYVSFLVKNEDDAAGIAEIQRLADILGVEVDSWRGTHRVTWKHSSGATWTASFNDAEARARVAAAVAARKAEAVGA